jgi:hypothetical protein
MLRSVFASVCFGLAVGGVYSAVGSGINIIASIFVAGVAIVIVVRKRMPTLRTSLIATVVGVVTTYIAAALPVKALDAKVPPLHFEQMRLGDLCEELDWHHHIWVHAEPENAMIQIAFSTERRMTKREVLEKLARDTGTELDIGYCGVGESLLFGAFPSFTRLSGPGGPVKTPASEITVAPSKPFR